MRAPLRESSREEEPVRRTYEDAFMEEVQNLGPVRQRRMPNRLQDYDCPFVESEIDDPSTIHEALNGKRSDQWKEAMKSEYSSLIKNDTWELVPPPEGKNIVGSRWVLKVKRNEDGSIDRFNIAAAGGVLSQYMSKPSKDHWMGVKRVLRYLKGTFNYGLKFSLHAERTELNGYSVADWAGDVDTRRSTSGYAFRFGNGTISWSSRKQPAVTKSSTEAEYVALSSATQEAIWLRRLMKDLG